jgi:hypothetical protein
VNTLSRFGTEREYFPARERTVHAVGEPIDEPRATKDGEIQDGKD